jgi:F-type H+-transporting ATPase subunit epsilon
VAKPFRCTIVTPAESLFDEEVEYASFPAWDGQQGVLAGESPLLTKLGIGPMRVTMSGGEKRGFLIDRGFAQIQNDVLTILTERAQRSEDIDADQAKADLADANSRAVAGGANREQVEADQAHARAALRLASR